MIYGPVTDLTIATFLTTSPTVRKQLANAPTASGEALFGLPEHDRLRNPASAAALTLRRSGHAIDGRHAAVAPRLRLGRDQARRLGRDRRRERTAARRFG